MPQIILAGPPPLTVNVEPLPALRSFDLQPRIMPLVGEVLRVVSSGIGSGLFKKGKEGTADKIDLLNVDVVQIAELALPALERACRLLPRGELGLITRELLEGATLAGAAGEVQLFGQQIGPNVVDTFDSAFRGRTLDTWRLLWFALRTHYPDLFGLLAASGGTATATASPSAVSST